MTELSTDGVTFTPEETAFFESGGTSPVEQINPETKPEPEVQPKPEEKPDEPKTVPLAAVHEERTRRKALQEKLRQIELENADLKGRFKIIEKIQEPKPEPRVNPQEDPFAAVLNHDKSLDDINKRLEAWEQEKKQTAEQNRLVSAYQTAASQYMQEKPDFMHAYNFLLNSRTEELKLLGYTDPVQLADALRNEEISIVGHALSGGMNPAETIYNLARGRGYAFKEPTKEAASAQEKLATIERGLEANKSLASTGGNAGDAEMSAERLLKMPIDEFEAWCNKNPAKARRLMGG